MMLRFLCIFAAFALVAGLIPYRWTHELDGGCHWQPRPWIGRLGAHEASGADLETAAVCRERKGLKSATPVQWVLNRWPDRTALNTERRDGLRTE